MLPNALTHVHELVAEIVREGDVVIDATAGNGHDTLFLARLVGPRGRVHAIDVQEEALRATRARLEAEGMMEWVTLHHIGHERMYEVVPEGQHGHVRAVTLNLGYLPGADKTLVTRPETTVQALGASLDILSPGGLVAVVCYTGHAGGQAEAEAVARWASELDQRDHHAVRYGFLNQQNCPPHAIVVEKRRE